jgi:predicted nucleic acid-binding protein
MYYLETNALYQARNIIRDVGNQMDDLYTSWLAIFELLSGTEETTWGARKAALSLVAEYQLKIATSTPAEIIASSFESIEFSAQKDRESIL